MSTISVLDDVLGLKSFIQVKLVEERLTYKELSELLQKNFPGIKGLSTRTLQRYCSNEGIQKTSKLSDDALDRVIEEGTGPPTLLLPAVILLPARKKLPKAGQILAIRNVYTHSVIASKQMNNWCKFCLHSFVCTAVGTGKLLHSVTIKLCFVGWSNLWP